MDMKGVVDFYKDDSADVRAFLAGNDILLMPDDLDVSTREIKKAKILLKFFIFILKFYLNTYKFIVKL